MIQRKKSDAKNYKLKSVAKEVEITDDVDEHRAVEDCKICKALYDYCRDMYQP